MNWSFISQKTAFFIVTAMKISNIAKDGNCCGKYFGENLSIMHEI
jgi:hypothetical protein